MVRYAKGAQAMSLLGVMCFFTAAGTSTFVKPYDFSTSTKLLLSSSSFLGTLFTLIAMALMVSQCSCDGTPNGMPQLPAYQTVAKSQALAPDGQFNAGAVVGYCRAVLTDLGGASVGLQPCLFKLGRACVAASIPANGIPANSFENVAGA
jgi:hypothetical protein